MGKVNFERILKISRVIIIFIVDSLKMYIDRKVVVSERRDVPAFDKIILSSEIYLV